jgi:hypothetical protein
LWRIERVGAQQQAQPQNYSQGNFDNANAPF